MADRPCRRRVARGGSSARFAPAPRPNRQESFFIHHEVPADHPDRAAGVPLQGPNQWPDDAEFREATLCYDAAVKRLGMSLLPALSVAVGEEPGFFAARFDPPSTELKLLLKRLKLELPARPAPGITAGEFYRAPL